MISYKLFKRIFCFVSYLNISIHLVSHIHVIKMVKNLIRNSIISLLQSTLIYLYNNDIKKIIGIIRKLEWMYSFENKGENEFNDEESNLVGKSEKSEEEEEIQITEKIKKEILNSSDAVNTTKKR